MEQVVLETGLEQPEAIALYRSEGFADVDGSDWARYAGYPKAVFLGRPLDRATD